MGGKIGKTHRNRGSQPEKTEKHSSKCQERSPRAFHAEGKSKTGGKEPNAPDDGKTSNLFTRKVKRVQRKKSNCAKGAQ